MIPQSYIEELVQRNDMVDVAQSYVQLRRRALTRAFARFTAKRRPRLWCTPRRRAFTALAAARGAT